MNVHNQKMLGEAIREFLRTYKLEEKITETRILSSWEKVVGPHIARYTRKISLKEQVLTVYLNSSVMRNELSLAREKIIGMINKEAGAEVVKEVHFR